MVQFILQSVELKKLRSKEQTATMRRNVEAVPDV